MIADAKMEISTCKLATTSSKEEKTKRREEIRLHCIQPYIVVPDHAPEIVKGAWDGALCGNVRLLGSLSHPISVDVVASHASISENDA